MPKPCVVTLAWSSSRFGVAICWAIVGQEIRPRGQIYRTQNADVPDLGQGKKPGTREDVGSTWLGRVDSANAGDFIFFNVLTEVRARNSALNIRFSSSESSARQCFLYSTMVAYP